MNQNAEAQKQFSEFEDYKIMSISGALATITHIISTVHEVTGVNIGFNNLNWIQENAYTTKNINFIVICSSKKH